MWAALEQKIKGWKTILWSAFLIVVGLVATVLQALDEGQLSALLPDKYKPFAPMLLSLIGAITAGLRWITTGPVGSKSDVVPVQAKAGD